VTGLKIGRKKGDTSALQRASPFKTRCEAPTMGWEGLGGINFQNQKALFKPDQLNVLHFRIRFKHR
jgi:hypothetical protein